MLPQNRKMPIFTKWYLLLFFISGASAAKSIFIVPFESQDVTLAPQAAEIERAASIAPKLSEILTEKGIEISQLSQTDFENKNVGTDFLYDRPQLVAKLAKENGSQQWAIVGRLYRPSHLFAYMQAKVIDIESGKALELLSVEIKGGAEKLMQRGINRLAEQINSSTEIN